MELYELVKDLFTYLTAFDLRVEAGADPTREEVKKDLLRIFHQQEIAVRRRSALSKPYSQVRYLLVVFADDIILNSKWQHAGDWESELLERRFFDSDVGGDRFFEICEGPDLDDPEVALICYRCLALGFKGRYEDGSEQLRLLKEELREKCIPTSPAPDALLCPEAYTQTVAGIRKLPVGLKWRHIAVVVLILVAAYLFVDRVIIWNAVAAPLKDVSHRAAVALQVGETTPRSIEE
jgi:type IV/VI secretion system ImpK/VasF family protein